VTRAGDGASIGDSDGARDDGSSTDAEWFCRSERRIAQECRTTVSGAISLSASACGRKNRLAAVVISSMRTARRMSCSRRHAPIGPKDVIRDATEPGVPSDPERLGDELGLLGICVEREAANDGSELLIRRWGQLLSLGDAVTREDRLAMLPFVAHLERHLCLLGTAAVRIDANEAGRVAVACSDPAARIELGAEGLPPGEAELLFVTATRGYSATKDHTRSGPSSSMLSCGPTCIPITGRRRSGRLRSSAVKNVLRRRSSATGYPRREPFGRRAPEPRQGSCCRPSTSGSGSWCRAPLSSRR
jgi:hypothetical protein